MSDAPLRRVGLTYVSVFHFSVEFHQRFDDFEQVQHGCVKLTLHLLDVGTWGIDHDSLGDLQGRQELRPQGLSCGEPGGFTRCIITLDTE